jgi:hypothetical protein
MSRWYVTFGQGTNLRNSYCVVEAETRDAAHAQVVAARGKSWAFLYSESDFAGQADEYRLTEVPLNGDAAVYIR